MSTEKFRVAPGHEFNYPADDYSRQALRNAGGRTKLSADQLKQLKFKTVKEGEDCSDIPNEAPYFTRDLFVERGWVERVPEQIEHTEVKK